MRYVTITFSVGIVCAACALAAVASPQTTGSRSDQLVDQALQLKLPSDSAQRRELLNEAVKADPDNQRARWQLGQVQRDGKWIDYKSVPNELSTDDAIREYRDIRSRFAMTRNGQLQLANWCSKHKLPERERAHLTTALALSNNSDDPVLRARLNFQKVDGVWTNTSELAVQKTTQLAEQKHIKNWLARVRLLAHRLDARRKSIRDDAIAELRRLKDPKFIPVLESVFLNAGLERERLLVELLNDMKSHKAADALARVAVFSNWDVVRKEAATELHKRPIETFAPELIRSLRTPIDSRISLYVGSGGVHLLRSHVSETQYVRQEIQVRSSVFLRPVILGSVRRNAEGSRARNRVDRVTANAVVEAELKGYAANRNAKLQSEMINKWNQRICAVLREGTGVEQPDDARQWWKWWNDYNQMEEEEKETQTRRYNEQRTEDVSVGDPIQTPPRLQPDPPVSPRQTFSGKECLVAGTPIWTDRGYVVVEEVQIGDLVLSQNPATGELSYRPVLRTTIRGEEPIMQVTTAAGTIRATGGHTFWVSGRGWSKLRLVKPGETFHSVDGLVEILSLKPAGKAKTYNLIIADDHTYFVGQARILSHDVTFAEPVDTVVPGLQPNWNARQ
jgi:hypothetical protein